MATTTTTTKASAPPLASGTPATPKTSSSSRTSSSTDPTSPPAKTVTSSTHHITKTSSSTTSTTSQAKTPPLTSSSTPTSTTSTTSSKYDSTTQSIPSSTGNTVPSTTPSSTSTSTSTYTTTSTDLLTTQSPSVSGTGDYTFTSLFTSTDSNGVSHTITQIIAQPSGGSRPGGFIHNAGAVAGVSILVGIAGAAAIAFGILYIRKRRKAQDEDFTAFSEMSYVGGGAPPDYGGAGSNQNNEYGLQPMNNDRAHRPGSSGSLYQQPLTPVDTLRDVHNPYPTTLPQTQFSGGYPAVLNIPTVEHQGYDTYAQNDLNQTPNHAGYNSHAEYHPDAGYNPYGGYNAGALAVTTPDTGAGEAMYDEDPFASHSQDGHAQFSSADHHENTGTAPHGRSASSKSRRNKSFKFGAEDGKYYGEHGPTNDDSSGVLGRPSTQLDHHIGEETMAPRANAYSRATDFTRQSDATLKAHYEYYRGNL